ncbi:MAG: lasso peptide biosynthesis PqqD family chaperone [Sarcina sp.]
MIFKRNENIDVSELDGQKVMMNIELGKYLMLNEVGSAIWDCIDGQNSIEKIVDTLMGEYDIQKDECTKSVVDYMERLKELELIESV